MTTAAIPRARGWPIVGAAWPIWRDPLAFLCRAHADLGPVFEVRAARRNFVVIAGAEANKFVATAGRNSLRSDGFWGPYARHHDCPHMILAIGNGRGAAARDRRRFSP